MSLVDDVTIKIKAGDGGNGSNAVMTTSTSQKVYSDGGNGGRGGDVYFKASHNISDLSQFRFQKEVKAEDGENGKHKNLTGKNGSDIYVLVPLGTTITDISTRESIELLTDNQTIIASYGGEPGYGNHDYKLREELRLADEAGGKGEQRQLRLILNLIADVGLVGLPNAGKSSLLEKLTAARPKIGNYPFTTLEPMLGTLGKIIIADIPGLIEGASRGLGLGIKFLKHIEKTKIFLHCIDSSSENVAETYQTIRSEFEKYDKKLLNKLEIILLTKKDLVSSEVLKKQIKKLTVFKKKIIPVSIYDEESIQEVKTILQSIRNA